MELGAVYKCRAGAASAAPAPFVVKTYKMVSDPGTDEVIAWGKAGNTFVVVDPYAFSARMLPSHFKHNNFSSFVRQLNTYGFRKVDPDRWEFAHESFLRGQTNLLYLIVRKESSSSSSSSSVVAGGKATAAAVNRSSGGRPANKLEGFDDEEPSTAAVVAEVVRLKQEQRDTEKELGRMWERLQETERKPRQMLAFLFKMAAKPQQPVPLLNIKQEILEEEEEEEAEDVSQDHVFFDMDIAAAASVAGKKRSLALTPSTFLDEGPDSVAVMEDIMAVRDAGAAPSMPDPFETTMDAFAGGAAGIYHVDERLSLAESLPYHIPDVGTMDEEFKFTYPHPYPQKILGYNEQFGR